MRKLKKKKVQRQSRKSLIERKLFFLFSVIVILIVTVVAIYYRATNPQQAEAANNCQKIILPAYFYPNPTTLWDKAIAAAPIMNMMIVDPANGPGTNLDVNYVNAIKKAKDAKIILLGYVTSSYTKRTTAQVEADIDKWRTMYGITDIFIDEATTAKANIPYYKTLYDYIKLKKSGAKVVLNPGVTSTEAEGYMAVSDVLVDFEGQMSSYKTYVLPSWVNKYPSSKFMHLVYGVKTQTDLQAVTTIAQQHNVDYIYITDDVLPNPWDTLPIYLPNLLTHLKSTCSYPTPYQPSVMSCTVSGNKVTWTWTPVAGGITQYFVHIYGDDGSGWLEGWIDASIRTYSITGDPGRIYNATVQGTKGGSMGVLSNISSCRTAFGTASKPPTITSVTWTPTSPSLNSQIIFTVKGTDPDTKKVGVTIFIKSPKDDTFHAIVPFGDLPVVNGQWTASNGLWIQTNPGTYSVYAEVVDGSNPAVKSPTYTYNVRIQ